MELYILDNLFRRETVVDRFESLIWTERFKDLGDFELVINSSKANRSIFLEGSRLALNESKRVMCVETIEDKKDDEGREVLTITGKSIEQILDDRVAALTLKPAAETEKWVMIDTPAKIAREIYKVICVDGWNHVGDKLPFVSTTNLYPPDTLPEPTEIVQIDLPVTTVLDGIKQVCDVFGLGFRMVRHADDGKLYFNIYAGNDRTTQQSSLTPVLFSADLDNLTNVTTLRSIESFKNTAYVFSPYGSKMVYADLVDPSIAGFERRVLMVDVTDAEEGMSAANLSALLTQRGKEALAAHRSLTAFDGEIPEFGSYKYGTQYELGDLVEMRNADGASNNMRVTEQIFVSDSEGERSYPTLSFEMYITPGSWRTWDYNQVWNTATKMWEQA